MGEPFFHSFDEIKKMNPWQVRRIIFYPRDESGNIIIKQKQGSQTYEEIFRSIWRQRGLDDAAINRKWEDYVGKQKRRNVESMSIQEMKEAGFQIRHR